MPGSIDSNAPLGNVLLRPAAPGETVDRTAAPALINTGAPARRSHAADRLSAGPAGAAPSRVAAQLVAVGHPRPLAEKLAEWDAHGSLDRSLLSRSGDPPIVSGAERNVSGVSLADVSRFKRLYDVRRHAVVTPEVPAPAMKRGAQPAQGAVPPHRAPEDPTEDPIEHKVITAEMGAGLAEFGVMGAQAALGKLSVPGQLLEALGTTVGMIPEMVALNAQRHIRKEAQTAQAAEIRLKEKILAQADALDRCLDRSPLIAPQAPQADERPDFAGLRGRLVARSGEIEPELALRILRSIDLLEQLYDGQQISETYLSEQLREIGHDSFRTKVALAGGSIETVGALATVASEIAEHSVPHVVGTVGLAAGAVGGLITLPFAYKFVRDNAQAITPHQEARRIGQERIAQTTELKSSTLRPASRPGALRRALAKLAVRRSDPVGKKIKTGIFSVGLSASVTGIAGYALAAAGLAAAAGALATVGLVLGTTALTGFVAYSIGRYLLNRRSAPTDRVDLLKKVITGEPNPISGPIKTRQIDKLMNRAFIASCEQFTHAALDQAIRRSAGTGRIDFERDIATPLRAHAQSLLDPGVYAHQTARALIKDQTERMVKALGMQLGLKPGEDHLDLPDAQPNPGAVIIDPGAALREAATRSLAQTLYGFNQTRTVLVQNRAAFATAFDRIEDALASAHYRITVDNRRAVAAALADTVPDELSMQHWGQATAETLAADDDRSPNLWEMIESQSDDLARAAALRKLLRRDPEALLLTYVKALGDAHRTQDQASMDQLCDDLRAFGANEETLEKVRSARDDTQIFHAAGLLAKELKFIQG